MRFTHASALLFAGKALALARQECLHNNSEDLAAFADCGHQGNLAECFAQLKSFDEADVKQCYASVGCKPDEAEIETKYTLSRCEELGKVLELKRRSAFEDAGPKPTVARLAVRADKPTAGVDCFSTYTTSEKVCKTITSAGRTTTTDCSSAPLTKSTCSEQLLCGKDSSDNDICMERHDIDTAGIVIAIVFAVIIAIGFGTLTFLCCKDKKEQKRIAAKHEAVTLARAATKKKNASERARLNRKLSGNTAAGASDSNPFQDQNRL